MEMKQIYLMTLMAVLFAAPYKNLRAQKGKEFDKIKSFIPPSYQILDLIAGDMNQDNLNDYALVLKSVDEDVNGNELRPLLIITGARNGNFTLLERNDSVVLCRNCGGIFGDPFQQLSFKNGLLKVENSVGSTWKWSRDISFRYDNTLKTFVLNDDTFSSDKKYASHKETAVLIKNGEDGKKLFKNFSFVKNY
jgi:hypothetical protein